MIVSYSIVNNMVCAKAGEIPSLDSLALAPFVHGFAIIAQNLQSQVYRCWRRYEARMV